MYAYIHTYTYVHVTTMKKAMSLEEKQGRKGLWERLDKGKDREEMM